MDLFDIYGAMYTIYSRCPWVEDGRSWAAHEQSHALFVELKPDLASMPKKVKLCFRY